VIAVAACFDPAPLVEGASTGGVFSVAAVSSWVEESGRRELMFLHRWATSGE
jgi:hypothetical protein